MRVTRPLNGRSPKPSRLYGRGLSDVAGARRRPPASGRRSRHGWCRARSRSCRRSAAIHPGWPCARRRRRRRARGPRHRPDSCARHRAGPPTTATIDVLFSAVERAWSAADCETMLRLESVSLFERSCAAQRSSARAASTADSRSLDLGLELGGLEARQHLAGFVTLSPSRTSTSARRPATRALTMVWSTGWVVPVKRTVSTSPRGLMVWTSCAISSSGRVASADWPRAAAPGLGGPPSRRRRRPRAPRQRRSLR